MEPYIEMGGCYKIKGENCFGRKLFIKPDDINKNRKKFNNTDVYCTLFKYDTRDQDESNLIGPLYIDLDYTLNNDKDFQVIKLDLKLVVSALNTQFKIPYNMIRIFFSGNKGFHIIIPEEIMGIVPCKNLNEQYKAIAIAMNKYTRFKTVDTRIYDNKRLFRLPNSINSKTGLYKVPITLSILEHLTYDQLKEYASKKRFVLFNKPRKISKAVTAYNLFMDKLEDTNKKYKGNIFIREMPPCIKAIEKAGAKIGARNNTAVVLASCYYQLGNSFEQAVDKMNIWNGKNSPPLDKQEITAVTNSAYRDGDRNRRYGCTSIKDLGFCYKELKCKFKDGGN